MYINKESVTETNLRDLIFYVLYRWRSILIIALAGALVLGGYHFLSTKRLHDEGKLTKEERQYQLDLQNYKETLENANNTIKENTRILENIYTYRNKSIWYQLDPTAIWTASCKFLVKVDSSVLDSLPQGFQFDPADSILPAYASPLTSVTDDEIREIFGTEEPEYVSELVSITTDNDENTIQVSVKGATKEIVEKGLLLLKEKIKGNISKNQVIEKHTLTEVNETIIRKQDNNLLEKQGDYAEKIEEYKNALLEARTKLNELENKKEPRKPGNGLIKYAIIGFILGTFLIAGLYAFVYLFQGRLTNGDYLSERYNLPVFGEFFKSGSLHNNRGLDKMICKLQLGNKKVNNDVVYNNIGSIISEQQGIKDILLVSTIDKGKIEPIREALSRRITGSKIEARGEFLIDSEAISEASKAEAVILVEEKGVSLNREIENLAKVLIISKANVIGVIAL